MANIPHDPMSVITAPPHVNGDLPPAAFPELLRIERDDLVGPAAGNRQPASLEKRTDTLLTAVNQLIEAINVLDLLFLRRDASASKDTVVGPTADLLMNGKKLLNMAIGSIAAGSAESVTGGQLFEMLPPGSVLTFAGLTQPTGYLWCNGAAISRTTYAALFAKIGTVHGVGNGTTTFNIPNLAAVATNVNWVIKT